MKLLGTLAVSIAGILAFSTVAFAAPDVEVVPGSIEFSEDILYANDQVTVYASLRNVGDVDIAGSVIFYQGDTQIDANQVISMPVDGAREDVFITMTVPTSTFNIRVSVVDTSPMDSNPSNNTAITTLITPVFDEDRDGVADADDNCPNQSNSNQADFDNDGLGDVCDDDIDGDGISNSDENANGTNPNNPDSDNDGIPDGSDSTPTGEVPPPPPEPEPVPEPVVAPEVEETAPEPELFEDEEIAAPSEPAVDDDSDGRFDSPTITSDNAVFTFEETSWATYNFHVVAPSLDEGVRYEWEFGDGSTSNRKAITHTYPGSGNYDVVLRVRSSAGTTVEDMTTINVPFFDLANSAVRMLVVFLIILLVLGISAYVRLGVETKKHKKRK